MLDILISVLVVISFLAPLHVFNVEASGESRLFKPEYINLNGRETAGYTNTEDWYLTTSERSVIASVPAPGDHPAGEIPKLTHRLPVTTSLFKYDVFINHRGKDVKNTVASLVYYNLRNKSLCVFIDKKVMEQGNSIPHTIYRAIRMASVHIVIFSKHYAESTWCLAELSLMVESGAPIIPIFYGVRPCDLRMQRESGVYSEAFQKHLLSHRVDSETVDKWKAALVRVSYNYGFEFEGDHVLLLERIADCVMKNIPRSRL